MNIKENLEVLLQSIPSNVRLIVVSKKQSIASIQEVYAAGLRYFGENRVQDLVNKQKLLPADIVWHFIGHLQTNKVKYIAPFVQVIQSVDSLKLLMEIDKEASRNERIIDCLLELYIATEKTKYGLDFKEVTELLSSAEFNKLTHVRITGVMGMATFSNDITLVNKEFSTLKKHFLTLKEAFFQNNPAFSEISMGMSGDYLIAIKQGSTMIRIGTAIFEGGS